MNDWDIKLERYRQENKNVKSDETVFAGSSLMEMFPINKLLEEHNDDTIIYNRGIGGYLTDLRPSKVFINIGTNDLSWADKSISGIMDNYDKIITGIEKALPDTVIYLMAYYPVNYEAAAENMKECLRIRNNEKLIAANAEVKKLAEKHGQRYIDINKNLKDGQGRLKAEYTIEGLHMNENGYRAIYDDIMAYVKEPVSKGE